MRLAALLVGGGLLTVAAMDCSAAVAADGAAAVGTIGPGTIRPGATCRLGLVEHRSDRPLAVVETRSGPFFEIAFEHSVLGTTVIDRYVVVAEPAGGGPAAGEHGGFAFVLVEERFSGVGYGLPEVAGGVAEPGGVQRLRLARRVEPLLVRPSAEQRTRLLTGATDLLLAGLTRQAIQFRVLDCDA